MAGPANFLLQQIAQGARFDGADRMYKGQQQGANMLADIQAQQDRNALAQIARARAEGGLQAGIQTAGQLGQYEPLRQMYGDQQAAEAARLKANQPMSTLGKARADLRAGNITPEDYRAIIDGLRLGKMPPFVSVPQGGSVYSTAQLMGGAGQTPQGQGAPQQGGAQPLVQRAPKPAQLSPTDKKAILEADAAIASYEDVIKSLEGILAVGPDGTSLNDRAGSGMLADAQSFLARNDPIEALTGTPYFDDKKGQATTELNNRVFNQALQSLKAIFGGMPTEGERKVLLDLQAAADKTPAEREEILRRAIEQGKISLARRRQQAAALREGTYYSPDGQPQQQSDIGTGNTPDEQAAINAARDAIARGADPMLVRQRLEQNGVDPAVLD